MGQDNSSDETVLAPRPNSPAPGGTGCQPVQGGSDASTLPVPGSGLPPTLPPQDLSGDNFVLKAKRMELSGIPVPSLGGIPLLAKLGQGGMGAVYYGIHPRLSKEVAIKVLPFHLAEQQPEMIQRFFREAKIAAQVQSPFLVNVTDVNQESGLYYLVMEFVSGESSGAYLKQLLKNGERGLPECEALDICIAASEGLAAAHAENIVHRDIKPDNIMIPKVKGGVQHNFKAAKLADLGLARYEGPGQSLTGAGVCIGTPGYIAPEQALDAKTVGKPGDVFSMGATLYALLYGKAPFTGEAVMKVLLATQHEPHTPIREVRPEVSAQTAELLDRCLAKDPAQRYADGAALVEALRACRTALGVTVPESKAAAAVRTAGVSPAAAAATPKPPAPQAAARKRSRLLIAAGVVVLGFVTALIFSFIVKVDKFVTCPLEIRADETTISSPKSGLVRQVLVKEDDHIGPLTRLVDLQIQTGALDEAEDIALLRELDKINSDLQWAAKGRQDQEERIARMEGSLRDEQAKELALEERIRKEKLDNDQLLADPNRVAAAAEANLNKARAAVDNRMRDADEAKVRAADAKKRYEQVKALVDKHFATIQELNQLQDTLALSVKLLADADATVLTAKKDVDMCQLQLENAKGGPKKLAQEWEQKAFQQNLERQDIQQRKTQLQANIANARNALDQGKEMLEKRKKELEEKMKKTAKAGQSAKEGVLAISSLHDGLVTKVNIKNDQQVARGEVLLSYVNEAEPVYGFVRVRASDRARIKVGQLVSIKYFVYPYQQFGIQSGAFYQIATKPNPMDNAGNPGSYDGRVRLLRQRIVTQKDEVDLDGAVGKILAQDYWGKSTAGERVLEALGTTVSEKVKEELASAGVKKVWVVVKEEPLEYGMQGRAEIKTGEQRLIEVIMRSLARWEE